MKAYLKTYRQAPRKVRLVGNLIKGKTVERALVELAVLPKRASLPMKKLLLSAVANAKENSGIEQGDLLVKNVRVDQGTILKRFMPKSHGSATPIHKHTSHVLLELAAHVDTEVKSSLRPRRESADSKSKVEGKEIKPVAKKPVAKKKATTKK